MAIILEVNDLSYQKFSQINLSFEDKTFYSIIGSNNCGKTTLFKLLSGIIPSNYSICCNYVDLNENNIFQYVENIGVIERVNKNSFVYQNVLDEMVFPLRNLGYSREKSITRIKYVLGMFGKDNIIDSKINSLNYYDKQLLLIMIALLHQPKVLLLDSVLDVFPKQVQEKIIGVFKTLINDGMTIINFTNSLEDSIYSDKIILLDKYQVLGEYLPQDIYRDDKLFYEHGLEIPFLIDLSIKLKMYNIVDKEYSNMKELVDDIWP